MSIKVRIPTPLRKLTGGKSELQVEGSNVKEVLETIERQFPGIKSNIYDEQGNLKRFVNIYLGEDNIVDLDKLETKLVSGNELSLVPAIAGGK